MTDAAYKRIALIFPMLSASNEGEVLNAARAMTKVLKDHNMHWTDVADRIRNGVPHEAPKQRPFERDQPRREAPNHGPRRQKSAWAIDQEDVTRTIAAADHGIDGWSQEFLQSIHDQVVHQGRSLTERQRDKLNEIMDKLGL